MWKNWRKNGKKFLIRKNKNKFGFGESLKDQRSYWKMENMKKSLWKMKNENDF